MNKTIRYSILVCVCSLLLVLCGTGEADEGSGTYALSVEKGLVSIEAENASLETILNELSQKTGAEFTARTTSVSTDLLSVSFKNLSLSEAIARVLKNYSYILEEGAEPNVIILASLVSREGPSEQPVTSKVYTVEPEPGVERKASQVTFYQPSERPFDLDECQALEFTEKDAAQSVAHLQSSSDRAKGDRGAGAKGQDDQMFREKTEENRKRLDDAKIKRAQKVLSMDRCSHLWEQAIEELSRIQDDRVTAILADTAQNGKTKELKEKAAQALWHNTADSEFKNTKGIDALKRLSSSSDPNVSMKAQQALKDYERYIRKNN